MASTPNVGRRQRVRLSVEELEPRLVLAAQPTAVEQLLLEQLNDIRANPAAYGQSIGLDLSAVAASPPLAFDTRLVDAALGHSQDMNDNNYFDHVSPGGLDPGDRISAAGYPWQSYGESIAAGYPSVAEALKGLIVDTGIPDLGHRHHLLAMDANFRRQNQVGVGIVHGSGMYGDYYTIDSGFTSDQRPMLLGVVYNDLNSNGKYDIGEGLGNVTVYVSGVGSTTTFGSGGYSLALNPGTYTVTVSGGSLTGTRTQTITVGSTNARLNFTTQGVATSAADVTFIQQGYQTALHRSASSSDVNYWIASMQNGLTHDGFTQMLFNSAEYRNRAGATYISQLYQDLLSRSPSSGELAAWIPIVQQGASYQDIAAGFTQSREYRALQASRFTTQAYQNILHRSAASSEIAYWTNLQLNGLSRDSMVFLFLGSSEYLNRNSSTSGFLSALYQDALGRTASNTEVYYWASRTQGGLTRQQVAASFVASAEYHQRQDTNWVGQAIIDTYHRTGSSNEVSAWVSQLQSTLTRDIVACRLACSIEYLTRAAG